MIGNSVWKRCYTTEKLNTNQVPLGATIQGDSGRMGVCWVDIESSTMGYMAALASVGGRAWHFTRMGLDHKMVHNEKTIFRPSFMFQYCQHKKVPIGGDSTYVSPPHSSITNVSFVFDVPLFRGNLQTKITLPYK